jgi:hypothetical protein
MQPSCPWLSLMMRAGFTVMALRQSNNPQNENQIQEHAYHFL